MPQLHKHFNDKRLDFCAYFLALIKTLDEQGETFETIRAISLKIVMEYIRPKNRLQLFLKRLPAKLTSTRVTRIFLNALNRREIKERTRTVLWSKS